MYKFDCTSISVVCTVTPPVNVTAPENVPPAAKLPTFNQERTVELLNDVTAASALPVATLPNSPPVLAPVIQRSAVVGIPLLVLVAVARSTQPLVNENILLLYCDSPRFACICCCVPVGELALAEATVINSLLCAICAAAFT